MPRHLRLPDWKFGDVLEYDRPSDPGSRIWAMFVGWMEIDEYPDPSNSVCVVASLTTEPRWNSKVGDIYTNYCGWWKDAIE